MEITPKVKKFLVDKHGLKTDATDLEAKKLLESLYAKGKITDEDLKHWM